MNKHNLSKSFLLIALSLCCLFSLFGCGAKNDTDYLVLVNKESPISPDYIKTVTLCDIENVDGGTYQVEKTTAEAFRKLADALKAKGVEIGVDSAYRSVEKQQQIMDEFTEKYGEEYAKKTVAIPGTSEHHTGLVIDIVPKVNGKWVIENEDMLRETEIFSVIHETMTEYGFILRYPKGKEAITGYDYEPWHLRFVGANAAKEIAGKNITLEEYFLK